MSTSVAAYDTVPASTSTDSPEKDDACEHEISHEHASYAQLYNNTWVVSYQRFCDIFKDDMNKQYTN